VPSNRLQYSEKVTTTPAPFPRESFRDVVSGNRVYAESFATPELSGWANRGLAVVTCMDSRIDPLRVLGMSAGDVKILRNAGARVTEDVLPPTCWGSRGC
jgi:carbonic anhydrase